MTMFELDTPVVIDSDTSECVSGVIVARGFDIKSELPYFDVRAGSVIIFNVKAHRIVATGLARKNVIGRDPGYEHNPSRMSHE